MEKLTKTKSILIVDDDLIDRIYLERYCLKRGLNYKSVIDGEEAIKEISIHKKKYDFILSDIDMPKTNGFQLAKWLRKQIIKSKSK